MRKLLLSLICMCAAAGLVIAGEVTLVKFNKDKKVVTVKDGDAEKTYKITDKTKFLGVDKDGTSKEISYDDAAKGLSNPKAEGRLKFDVTVKGDEITEAKVKARKK